MNKTKEEIIKSNKIENAEQLKTLFLNCPVTVAYFSKNAITATVEYKGITEQICLPCSVNDLLKKFIF